MRRGTTPTHTFTFPFSLDVIAKLRVIYKQDDSIVLVKTLDDCIVNGNSVSYKLTQEETLLFNSDRMVDIQIRALTAGNDSLVSRVYKVGVDVCLENEAFV